MDKEDKQIIDRATKEEWRLGDRTRLKHLLEKNLKLYRENAELKERLAETNLNGNIVLQELTKAKEIIKDCIHILKHSGTALDWKTVINQAEQFLKADVGTKNYEEQDKILKTRLL